MHRSRLDGLFIDPPDGEAPAAATFWSSALGVPARPTPGEEQFIHTGPEFFAAHTRTRP